MSERTPPEINLSFWPFKLLAKGNAAMSVVRWPVLVAIAACIMLGTGVTAWRVGLVAALIERLT